MLCVSGHVGVVLVQAVSVDAIGVTGCCCRPVNCRTAAHISLASVRPPVELLQTRPVMLYNLLANSLRDGTRFLDAASSHKLILLAQQRLDEWRDVFRITRLDGFAG